MFVIILEISASVSNKLLRAIIIHADVDINAVTIAAGIATEF
jgi:hypothetical protein